MKVTLRSKPIGGGKLSLYLDYYPPVPHPLTKKPTRREFLELYIVSEEELKEEIYQDGNGKDQRRIVPVLDKSSKPKKVKLSPIDKGHNYETYQLAENIKAKRQLEIQAGNYGFLVKQVDADILSLFEGMATARKAKKAAGGRDISRDSNNWQGSYNYFARYTNGFCTASMVNDKFCEGFKDYLLTAKPKSRTKEKLAHNTAVHYYTIFKTMLSTAFRDGHLKEDIANKIGSIEMRRGHREFLTIEEILKLHETPCDLELLKRAAIFSALTGLRYSDIYKLTWGEIRGNEEVGYSIHFTQEKTDQAEYHPIPLDAYPLLGPRMEDKDRPFGELLYSWWQNQKLQEWVNRAGINRKITFHSFRHTYATMLLTMGEDIYTVSKLMGHKAVKTTEIYAHMVNKKKQDAANKLKLS